MDQRSESPQPEINQASKSQENTTPKVKVTERIKSVVSFLKGSEAQQKPDMAFQTLANGIPVENKAGNAEENITPEQQRELDQAKGILRGLKTIGDTLKRVKDNDLLSGAVVTGLGLAASYVGVSSHINMLMEAAAVTAMGGGTKMDMVKNTVLSVTSMVGTDAVGEFFDMGQKAIEGAIRNDVGSKIATIGRSRLRPIKR